MIDFLNKRLIILNKDIDICTTNIKKSKSRINTIFWYNERKNHLSAVKEIGLIKEEFNKYVTIKLK